MKPIVIAFVLIMQIMMPAAEATNVAEFRVGAGKVESLGSDLVVDRLVVDGVLLIGKGVTIHAFEITIRGVVQAADGEPASPIVGDRASAQAGEDGGAIVLIASSLEVADSGVLRAGSGGAGGDALGRSRAVGGAGGSGGDVVIFATALHLAGIVAPGRGGDGGHGVAESADGWAGSAAGGAGGDSGVVVVNGAYAPLSLPRLDAPASSLGSAILPCGKPQGDPGGAGLGDGGAGGKGCARSSGRPGEAGEHGSSGAFSCTPGGHGVAGGPAGAGAASGGPGGQGVRDGGRGGDADASAFGGPGGDGGIGGKATFARNCAGGNGGPGGEATAGTARGGDGGTGACGRGGDGGDALAEAVGGLGGKGGDGSPRGQNGLSGASVTGAASGGSAGAGLNLCAGYQPPMPGGLGPLSLPDFGDDDEISCDPTQKYAISQCRSIASAPARSSSVATMMIPPVPCSSVMIPRFALFASAALVFAGCVETPASVEEDAAPLSREAESSAVPLAWGDESAPIRPGASLGGYCTFNWLYFAANGSAYIGTAAHCTEELGERVELPGVGEVGSVVYDSDVTEGADEAVDLALVLLDAGMVAQANPRMLGSDGPVGFVTAAETELGDVLGVHGYGLILGENDRTRMRSGVLVSDDDRLYTADLPAVNGDSGAPLIHVASGKALGIISHYGVGALPPTTDEGPTMPFIFAELAKAGFVVELATV